MTSELLLNRYRLLEVVRSRGLATTHRALDERTGETVAVRLVPAQTGSPSPLLRAFMIGSRLSHPNLMRYHHRVNSANYVGLVTDFVEGEPLLTSILAFRQSETIGAPVTQAFCQLCNVVEYLHSENLVHGNLTPDVILLTSSGTLKLIDLAHCEELGAEQAFWHDGLHGTPRYSSPEHQKGRLAPESDYFVIGILLFEHLTGTNPFWAPRLDDVFIKIREGESAELALQLARTPRELRHSVTSLLSTSLDTRRSGWRALRTFLEARQAE